MIHQLDEALLRMLRAELADILPQPELVCACSPDESGDARLGLHLFSVQPCKSVNPTSISAKGRGVLSLPPRFLTLSYLLTAYGKADKPYRAVEEHLILSRAMQVFEKKPTLTQSDLGFAPGQWIDALHVRMIDLDIRDMSYIWSFGESAQKLSVAYSIEPVELPVNEGRIVGRVSGASTSGEQL